MGGLSKRMPITTLTFGIGVLAISGFPFLSGFFSKDAILIAANLGNLPMFITLMIAAFLTSFYMGRLYWITFFGKPGSDHAGPCQRDSYCHVVTTWLYSAILSIAGG